MTFHAELMRRTALATVAVLPFVAMPAHAQTDSSGQASSEGAATETQPMEGADPIASPEAVQADAQGGTGGDVPGLDAIVARVGPIDIQTGDVMRQIGMLPERFQAQPPELLIPMALEQLVLRQVILQQATTMDFADEPEVQAAAESAAQTARENVLVQTYIQRTLDDSVSDQRVQEMYDRLQENSAADLPPLEAIRPQIEQQLRQQEIARLSREMLESDLVVFYGPDGEPVEAQELGLGGSEGSGGMGSGMGTEGSASGSGETQSGETDSGTESEESEQEGN